MRFATLCFFLSGLNSIALGNVQDETSALSNDTDISRPNLRNNSFRKVKEEQEIPDADHDEIYPPGEHSHHDPNGDDDEEYPPGDNSKKSQPYIQLSQPHEYIEFKSNFNLRHEAVLELHDLNKNNNIVFVNNKYYSVDLNRGFEPMDIYADEGAEYHLDGIDHDEKLYSSSSSVYIRRQGSDAILISRELYHNEESGNIEFSGEILAIDIMGENGGDFHLAAVAPGILATVKAVDMHPEYEAKLKILEMNGLHVPAEDQYLLNEDNVYHESASDEVVVSARNRRQLTSAGCSEYHVEDIAIVFDSTFCAKSGGHAQTKAKLESIVSKSSLIYQRQNVCVKIKILSYEGHCASNFDPYKPAMKTGTIGCHGKDGVLQYFANYWRKNRETQPRVAVHLFFAVDFDENTVGCAYIDVLCNKMYGFGANDMNYSSNTYMLALLFTHELGHNNGLEHIISSGHTNPFIMRSEVKSGESVWSSESVTKLRTVIPSKSCISKETGGSTCTDIPGWHDKDGPAYNCAWYAIGSNCDDYGHGWKFFGKTAAQACCTCGGGMSSFHTDNSPNAADEKANKGTTIETNITCGCPDACTSSILGTKVDDRTIEEHIYWIVDNLNESEEEACELVCGEEYDDICGDQCNPSQCKLN